jgi:5-methylcytosine-specific restriction enzyme subunit McrC
MRLTAVEHGPLRGTEQLGHVGCDRLMRSAARLPSDVFRRTSNGIRVGGYVGVVDLGWCQVELLPKIAEGISDAERRRFLLNLLDRSGLIPRPLISSAAVDKDRGRLLESLIAAFAEHLHTELLRGVPRRYEVRNERMPQVKGRILFGELARSLPSRKHLIPVRHAPLQYDNDVTRVLRGLVDVLSRHSLAQSVVETLDHCGRMLGAVSSVPLERLRPGRIRLPRQERRWQPFLDLAEMVRSGQLPVPISPGRAEAFGLLFSLHDVFERLIRRALTGRLFEHLELRTRPTRPRLLHPIPDGPPVLKLRPDLLIAGGSGDLRLVADAKWKRLDGDSSSYGLSPSDVYQVTTYMAAHSVVRGILLFPELPWMLDEPNPWYRHYSLVGGQGQLMIGGVDVVGLASREPDQREAAVERLTALLALAADMGD